MCYRFLLLASMLLIPFVGFTQSSNWNSTINLNVTVNSSDRIDLYTDKDGNHVIVQKSNQLVYYLFSATGTQIRTSVRDNDVSEDPRLSRIVGWDGKLYIIYKEGNKIKTQRSTNAGATWSTTAVQEIIMANSISNGIDAWTDANGVHLVFSEDEVGASYKTWYQRNPFNQSNWVEQKDVTDLSGDAGGFPSVTTSANRVHVAFTDNDELYPGDGDGDPRSRDRSSGAWQSSYLITSSDVAYGYIIANSSMLHSFYYIPHPLIHDLKYRNRSLSGTTWTATETLLETDANAFSPLDMAVTADDQVHVFYIRLNYPRGVYNVRSTDWGTAYTLTSMDNVYHQRIAANSNDIYAVWNTGSTLKLRQRDFAPLTPTGVSGSIADPSGDKHPRLDWNLNGEADLSGYEIHKKVGGGSWAWLTTTTNTYYVDETVTGASFQQYSNNVVISYKIRAKDLQNHLSDFSSQVDFNTRGSGQEKPVSWRPVDSSVPGEFALLQNYPNPFNPLTTIQFGLKEAGAVEVTVYSVEGRKIAALVNEFMEAGMYQVQWDGKDAQGRPASSGMYLYQLKAGGQMLVKKMMLVK